MKPEMQPVNSIRPQTAWGLLFLAFIILATFSAFQALKITDLEHNLQERNVELRERLTERDEISNDWTRLSDKYNKLADRYARLEAKLDRACR